MVEEIRHVYEAPLGSVDLDVEELAKGGVKITVKVRRPREADEDWATAAIRSADIARLAYDEARERFPQAGAS